MRPQYGNFFSQPSRQGRATIGLLIAIGVGILLSFFLSGDPNRLPALLGFIPSEAFSKPWTFLTYPFVFGGFGFIFFLAIFLFFFYQVGTQVEAEIGEKGMLLAFFGFTLIGSLSILAGSFVVPGGTVLVGPYLPIASIALIWGSRNRNQDIMFFGLIRMKAFWLAIILSVSVLFSFGTGAPLLGFFALIPLGLAWMYGDNKLPIPYGRFDPRAKKLEKQARQREEKRSQEYLDKAKDKQKEREERERLRKLFESSLDDDDEKKR
jgi:signal transduction histidine kinase